MSIIDIKDLKETENWALYDQCKNYANMMGIYSDTDRNFRMYNGNQNEGLKIAGIEPIQLNFIRPIVRYKVGTINQNLWAINFSSENFENEEFMEKANKTCELLNKKVSKIWEKANMDYKVRKISKNSAINDESIMYSYWNKAEKTIETEIISKNDIGYGNENDSEIQLQPYILIKRRKHVIEVKKIAEAQGVPTEKLDYIVGDNQVFEESGESAKYEKDNMCTVITKFYKENGIVYYTESTRFLNIKENVNSGLSYYPIEHMIWEEKEGSARGEGEVRALIPNQLEVNKTLMRRALVAKNTAYPQKVVNTSVISNPKAINEVGGIIKVNSTTVEDVRKAFSATTPTQMSPDVEKLQKDLIETSRALAGASDASTGDIRPDEASGKAILAVQQASQLPLVDQLASLKAFIEGTARIWLNMIIVYNSDGIILEEEIENPMTGEISRNAVKIDGVTLQELQASVKVDITPQSALDKMAQEMSMENLLKGGWFAPDKIGQLKMYIKALPDNSNMPKQMVLKLIKTEEEKQRYIAQLQSQAQMMIQNATNFINNDPDTQASQLVENENATPSNEDVQVNEVLKNSA